MWGKGGMTLEQVIELSKETHPRMTDKDVIGVMLSDIQYDWLKLRQVRAHKGEGWVFLWRWSCHFWWGWSRGANSRMVNQEVNKHNNNEDFNHNQIANIEAAQKDYPITLSLKITFHEIYRH